MFLIGAERPERKQIVGALISLCGLGFLSLQGYSIQYGDLLILGCAVFFAIHIIILAKIEFASTSTVLAFIQLLAVGTLSLIWSIVTDEFSVPDDKESSTTIVVLAIFGTALAYVVQTRAQAVLFAQKVALLLICEPIFSGYFGYLLAGDRLTLMKIFGACLIVTGIVASKLKLRNVQRRVSGIQRSGSRRSGRREEGGN